MTDIEEEPAGGRVFDLLAGQRLIEQPEPAPGRAAESKPFGITVRRAEGGWAVYLPHQCDQWMIAGEIAWGDGVPQVEAVAALEHLIAEAQRALAALRAEEEFGK